ncbi:hypothetical protein M6B38_307530 [Iris pallida]|uniref:Uncharacterized protein n=1 Tax=Iris pallida TaxID=29817 RepID=A0AAX6HKS4_IRIPA|nr:hypothetical protein M6B38_307530 [Iris pallida]
MERQIEWVETRNRLGSRMNVGSCFLWTRRVVSELVFSFPWIPLQITSSLSGIGVVFVCALPASCIGNARVRDSVHVMSACA